MSDAQQKLEAIKRLLLADLEATSDEDLRKEFVEDGKCPEKVAEGVRVSLETLIQKFGPARGATACRAEPRGTGEWVCDCTQMRPDCKPTAGVLASHRQVSQPADPDA